MSDYVHKYRQETAQRMAALAEATKDRCHAPHCDQRVLHSPGTCWACDGYPDWQQARTVQQINFTDEEDPTKAPCPARLERSLDTINHWGGNVAETAEQADLRSSRYMQWIKGLFN